MLAGDLGAVATAALYVGERRAASVQADALCGRSSRCSRNLRRTLRPRSSGSMRLAVEWKFDGARLQVHVHGDEVRAYTRNLADVTDQRSRGRGGSGAGSSLGRLRSSTGR